MQRSGGGLCCRGGDPALPGAAVARRPPGRGPEPGVADTQGAGQRREAIAEDQPSPAGPRSHMAVPGARASASAYSRLATGSSSTRLKVPVGHPGPPPRPRRRRPRGSRTHNCQPAPAPGRDGGGPGRTAARCGRRPARRTCRSGPRSPSRPPARTGGRWPQRQGCPGPWLGTAKAAGAAGLLVGLFVQVIGIVAGIGLVLYFAGAVITVVRARLYSHIPYPLLYMAPVVGSLALGFAA
jgi:DoxX-like family